MIIRRPVYNREFHCIGGACPDTCCRDWSIVPDEQSLKDYELAPEPLRAELASAMTTDDDGDVCFRLREDGFCVLLTEDGLCPIQRDWGEEHLCAHCAAYPRFTEEYGSITETALAISCPEAARLLMECPRFELEESDDGKADEPFDEIDPEELAGLEHSRKIALNLLRREDLPLWERLAQLVSYTDDLQDCIDFGAFSSMNECEPESVEEMDGSRRMFTALLMDYCADLEALRQTWPELLKRRSEELKKMKKNYGDTCTMFERACPHWEKHLTNLACYLVFRHWHKTVNDDGLYGRGALVGAACLILYHLCMLEWRECGGLTQEQELALWSAFSREIEHLDENLTDLVETLFDNENWQLLSALCGNG